MRPITILIFSLFVLLRASAAPFEQEVIMAQPDGSKMELWIQGDEFHSVYETTDGYTVTLNPETGFYHYASLSPEGDKLLPTGPRVGTADPLELEIPKHLRISEEARARQIAEERGKWNQEIQGWQEKLKELRDAPVAMVSGESEAEASPQAQSQPIAPTSIVALTILVDFSDDPATVSKATLDNLLNSPSGNSVRKYYSDNSNGLMTYTNVLTPYVRVARSKADYALIGNSSHNLKIDAIDALKALPNYQSEILPTLSGLTKLDNNHIFCNVFYAGGSGPMGAQTGYAAAQDLGGNLMASGFTVQPIGNGTSFSTFAHESGHLVFGFPDLYDYNSTYKGAGAFCLMSSGGNLSPPAQICAYLKAKAGWATVTDITSGSFLTATVGAQGSSRFNHFYRYRRPGSDTEYFIIENRQKQGQDAALPGRGVFIWHVDELGNNSRPNLLPNATHNNYELSLEQADNLFQLQNAGANWGDANDPYYNGNPAAAYAGIFDDFSAPSAKWWDGNPSGMHLSHFSSNGTEMTFQVGNPQPYVIGKDATLVREGYAPANNVIDPGETVTVRFHVRNAGFGSSSNAVVTLLAQGGVSSPGGPQSLGVLAAQTDAYVDLTFTANAALGERLSAVIQIAEASKVYGSFSNSFTIGEMGNTFWTQNFDSVTAPNLPSGWTTSASVGTAALWKTSTAVRDTLPNSAFVAEGGGNDSTVALTSPVVAIAHSSTQLGFRHSYNTERDAVGINGGGVLEIKIGSDPWQDVVTAGGTWVTNGYNLPNLDASYGNPLGFRSAWGGYSGGFITTLVNLPPNVGGKNVQFRWLYGYDRWAPWGGSVGWYVDTVSLIGPIAVSPTVEVSPRHHDFGSATIGQTVTKSFVATNTGTQSISGTISVTAPFRMVGSTSYSLGAGQSTTVNVAFAPQTTGNFAANLFFTSAGRTTVSPILTGIATDSTAVQVTQWPTASGITYGQPLSASTLSGGTASVAGTFSFSSPATIPNVGNYNAAVTFTPANTSYMPVSGSVSVTVTTGNRVPENPSNVVQGVDYHYYEGRWSMLPNFSSLTAVKSGAIVNFSISPKQVSDYFGFQFTGFIEAPTSGVYTFHTTSDDGSALYIGSTRVVNNDGLHGMQERSGTISLAAGKHAIRVEFFEAGSGEGLQVRWQGPGIAKQTIPNTRLWRPDGRVPWTPASLTLRAWYDANDSASLATSSGVVNQWSDKSGNGRHVSQSVSTRRPGISSSTVSFDGADDYLMHNAAFMYAAGSVDIYMVAAVGATADRRLVSENHSASNNPLYNLAQTQRNDGSIMSSYIRADDNTIFFTNASSLSGTGAFARTLPKIYQWRDTGSSVSGRIAGGNATSVSYTRSKVMTLDRFTLGAIGPRSTGSTTGSWFANAGINEVVITPVLSDADRQKMEGYLAHKWDAIRGNNALASALPATHPWKAAAPGMQMPAMEAPQTAWAVFAENSPNSTPEADDDGDGLTNFHEVAFGTNPAAADTGMPVTMEQLPDGGLAIRYQRAANSGLNYTVWMSPDLVKWVKAAGVKETLVETYDDGTELIEAEVESPPDGPACFLRVKAD